MIFGWELVLIFGALIVGFWLGRLYQREEDYYKQACNRYGSYTKMCNKKTMVKK